MSLSDKGIEHENVFPLIGKFLKISVIYFQKVNIVILWSLGLFMVDDKHAH